MKRGATLLAMVLLLTGVAAAQQAEQPVSAVQVGDQAPDFRLRDQNGNWFQLSDYRGKKQVVVAFYVLAFTGG